MNEINPDGDGEYVDVTADGRFIFGSTYDTSGSNKLMEYANDSVGYEVIQTIKDGAVHSYGGFITDDYQMIGSAANNSINIYENYGNNTFFFSYSLSTGLTGIIVKLEVSEDATFLVVSF